MRSARALIKGMAATAALCLALLAPPDLSAFPDAEKVWEAGGGPPFNFGLSSLTSGFLLISDRELAVSYGEVLELFDMGAFDLEPEQPPSLSVEKETDGIIGGIAYTGASRKILASQQDGDLLEFTLANITAEPIVHVLAEEKKLGPLAHDPRSGYSYVSDSTSLSIISYDIVTGKTVATIPLTVQGQSSFRITDALYVDETREIYFSTDVGAVFYVVSGGTAAISINVALSSWNALSALTKLPGGTEVWVADFDGSSVHRISTSTHSVTGDAIDLSPNSSPTDIAITQVKNPTATYAYVAGASGVSVVNTATGEVLDMGSDPAKDHEPIPTSAEPFLVEASSKEDGNVYVDFITGQVGIITANPLVAIASIAYSGGGSSLGVGGTMDVEFLVDEDSTYEFRSGGDIYGSGALLVDSAGSTSGSVIADEPTTATIPFDANKDAFDEGENDLWVFATSDGLRGRIAAAVSVDTPPPDVVVRSTGFGSSRVYVNFDRVDVSDMASYNVYVDTDPDAVLTKADAQASVSQPSGGSSVTGEVGGLSNGTLYYMAVEAVDEAGNTSDTRTAAFPDGSRVTAMPEKTVGPAGSEGCGLVGGGMCGGAGMIALAAGLFALVALGVRRARATMLALLAAASFLFAPTGAAAQLPAIQESPATPGVGVLEARSPNAWGFEAKTGFWMPSSSSLDRYFGTCCNLITRLEGSYLIDRKYGLEFGAGFLYKSGKARGEESGQVSQDSFTFLMFPLQASFAWRADYFSWRYLIPYAKAGFDSVIYRESVAGDSVAGVKWGMHVVGGTMLNISEMTKTWGDTDVWVDEFFMTFEAAYQYVSSFGSGKLDLSGPVFSVGLLFYF